MAGRFGKYGDLKRRKVLRRGRKEKARLNKALSKSRWHGRRAIPPPSTVLHPAAPKSYKSAVVIIPPHGLWPSIQALRQQYDRHFRRWMPHITLLYPFRPPEAFARISPILARVCRSREPFEVKLRCFDFFVHSRRSATFYLVPEPCDAVSALHRALLDKVSDCSDVARFAGGFTPHLSLGQTRSGNIADFCSRRQATWRPLSFTLKQVHLIWRNDPPDDIFRIGPVLSLGSQ